MLKQFLELPIKAQIVFGMTVVIAYVIAIGILILFGWYGTHYLIGWFPKLRARALTEDEKDLLRRVGLSHATTKKGLEKILESNSLKPSNRRKSYSNHFVRCGYFCFGNVNPQDGFNMNVKYERLLIIKGLSEEQINAFRIREYDNALIYKGAFDLTGCCIEAHELERRVGKFFLELIKSLLSVWNLKDAYNRAMVPSMIVMCGISIDIILRYVPGMVEPICYFIAGLLM